MQKEIFGEKYLHTVNTEIKKEGEKPSHINIVHYSLAERFHHSLFIKKQESCKMKSE